MLIIYISYIYINVWYTNLQCTLYSVRRTYITLYTVRRRQPPGWKANVCRAYSVLSTYICFSPWRLSMHQDRWQRNSINICMGVRVCTRIYVRVRVCTCVYAYLCARTWECTSEYAYLCARTKYAHINTPYVYVRVYKQYSTLTRPLYVRDSTTR